MNTTIRLSGKQHKELRDHLYPGDGNEAVAIALCGRRNGSSQHCLSVSEIVPVPYGDCSERTPVRLKWKTDSIIPALEKAAELGLAVLKIHSHPGGFAEFSEWDDRSDRDLFASVYGWMDSDLPHASAVMLPDGEIFGRTVDAEGEFGQVECVSVAGDDLYFWHREKGPGATPEFSRRHDQAFGKGTTSRLQKLTAAVIGCSGTGSPTIEQLARLGIGKLVLVDPDVVEEKNLNRILHSTAKDAADGTPKVEVMKRSVESMGLGTVVEALQGNLFDPGIMKKVAECDVLFGCMDSIDGRYLLNRLATFYSIPYFDIGVRLDADGTGGIDQICGSVNYLQPGGSSLVSRGTLTLEQVRAAGLKRTDPDAYKDQVKAKYITGAQEDRPAVISVNMLFASLGVNEFLARLHPYREDPNGEFAAYRISLSQAQLYQDCDGEPCRILSKHVGRGDALPLLGLPEMSE